MGAPIGGPYIFNKHGPAILHCFLRYINIVKLRRINKAPKQAWLHLKGYHVFAEHRYKI